MSTPPSAPDMRRASDEMTSDPELLALPTPPRRIRTVSLLAMTLTMLVALSMVWALRGELRYAFRSAEPMPMGELARLVPDPALADAFVHGTGRLDEGSAIRYERFLEPDAFYVARVVGNPGLWVELRQPSAEPVIPQTSFVGRLVPLASAGLSYRGLASRIEEGASADVGREAWLLVEGRAPASSRWAIALASVLLLFAGWNLLQLLRLGRRVSD